MSSVRRQTTESESNNFLHSIYRRHLYKKAVQAALDRNNAPADAPSHIQDWKILTLGARLRYQPGMHGMVNDKPIPADDDIWLYPNGSLMVIVENLVTTISGTLLSSFNSDFVMVMQA
jgi:hypothetical protein